MKEWSDKTILKIFKNPSKDQKYKITSVCSELTFIGVKGETIQPDFAEVKITMIPNETIMDLKSLKIYLQQFRDKLLSYERLLIIIYNDINDVFNPKYLKVNMKLNPRGGIYSELEISSEDK